MTFTVTVSAQAERFLASLPTADGTRIARSIDTLKLEPMQHDTRRVHGQPEKMFRVRVGNHRILYTVTFATQELHIVRIDKRSRAYD